MAIAFVGWIRFQVFDKDTKLPVEGLTFEASRYCTVAFDPYQIINENFGEYISRLSYSEYRDDGRHIYGSNQTDSANVDNSITDQQGTVDCTFYRNLGDPKVEAIISYRFIYNNKIVASGYYRVIYPNLKDYENMLDNDPNNDSLDYLRGIVTVYADMNSTIPVVDAAPARRPVANVQFLKADGEIERVISLTSSTSTPNLTLVSNEYGDYYRMDGSNGLTLKGEITALTFNEPDFDFSSILPVIIWEYSSIDMGLPINEFTVIFRKYLNENPYFTVPKLFYIRPVDGINSLTGATYKIVLGYAFEESRGVQNYIYENAVEDHYIIDTRILSFYGNSASIALNIKVSHPDYEDSTLTVVGNIIDLVSDIYVPMQQKKAAGWVRFILVDASSPQTVLKNYHLKGTQYTSSNTYPYKNIPALTGGFDRISNSNGIVDMPLYYYNEPLTTVFNYEVEYNSEIYNIVPDATYSIVYPENNEIEYNFQRDIVKIFVQTHLLPKEEGHPPIDARFKFRYIDSQNNTHLVFPTSIVSTPSALASDDPMTDADDYYSLVSQGTTYSKGEITGITASQGDFSSLLPFVAWEYALMYDGDYVVKYFTLVDNDYTGEDPYVDFDDLFVFKLYDYNTNLEVYDGQVYVIIGYSDGSIATFDSGILENTNEYTLPKTRFTNWQTEEYTIRVKIKHSDYKDNEILLTGLVLDISGEHKIYLHKREKIPITSSGITFHSQINMLKDPIEDNHLIRLGDLNRISYDINRKQTVLVVNMDNITGTYQSSYDIISNYPVFSIYCFRKELGNVYINGNVAREGDRVLLNGQTDSIENGIYIFRTVLVNGPDFIEPWWGFVRDYTIMDGFNEPPYNLLVNIIDPNNYYNSPYNNTSWVLDHSVPPYKFIQSYNVYNAYRQEIFDIYGDGSQIEWTFNHSFGSNDVDIEVYDVATGITVNVLIIRKTDDTLVIIPGILLDSSVHLRIIASSVFVDV